VLQFLRKQLGHAGSNEVMLLSPPGGRVLYRSQGATYTEGRGPAVVRNSLAPSGIPKHTFFPVRAAFSSQLRQMPRDPPSTPG